MNTNLAKNYIKKEFSDNTPIRLIQKTGGQNIQKEIVASLVSRYYQKIKSQF